MTSREQEIILTKLEAGMKTLLSEVTELKKDNQTFKTWKNQIEGAYKAIVLLGTGFGVILGVVATLIATYQPREMKESQPRKQDQQQIFLIPQNQYERFITSRRSLPVK
jgi:hypothetical protein